MQINKTSMIAVLVLGTMASAGVQPLMARDSLVGKWTATVTSDDGGKQSTDTISFKGGQFTSDTEKTDGFQPAAYSDDPGPQGIGAQFSVTLTNKAGDTAKWTGFSTGSDIDGTLVITRKNGTAISYTYKATKA
jgi:hypothetical protein